jgi:hypothetical protein
MATEPPIRSDLPYDVKQRLRKELSFDTLIDEYTEELLMMFDSLGDRSVARQVEGITGMEIKKIRNALRLERIRLQAIIDVMEDVDDQIFRTLQ